MSNQETSDNIDNDDRWDTGELGRNEKYVKNVEMSFEERNSLDLSLGLETVNIRLPINVIKKYKMLGEEREINFLILMRQALFVYINNQTQEKNINLINKS